MSDISGQTSIVINAPVAEVYAYLLDFTRHPEWVRNLQRGRPESGNSGQVGATFQTQEGPPPVALRQKLPMMFHFLAGVLSGAKTYSRAEITGLEPNRRIAWQAGIPKRSSSIITRLGLIRSHKLYRFFLNGTRTAAWQLFLVGGGRFLLS